MRTLFGELRLSKGSSRLRPKPASWVFAIILLVFPWSRLVSQRENIDAQAMRQIREEGLQRSHCDGDAASWLTDVFGPRVTGAPNTKRAADWTCKR